MSGNRTREIRCAIYTRKSSQEGLEQDFTSLHAQREACAAYILRQAGEGWDLVPEHYDDSGKSGGTMERPALQRLLADIEIGLIDIVVVYKVDRLTRSLLDFAKLVEAMDKAKVSFVSVTQSFNTTNSMGRLTLNMLLSFAQFEREVTAERIRDKIAASKAKGMWMGGVPPLGYEPDGRSLKIVEEHAELVRLIFARYLELKNVTLLCQWLEKQEMLSPLRHTRTGKAYGGGPFFRGQLYTILRNPIYIGLIHNRGETYEGLHEAIVDLDIWDQVPQQLADNRQGPKKQALAHPSLLAGKVVDHEGRAFQCSHTNKGSRRYRYYVLPAKDEQSGSSVRISATELERVVRSKLADILSDPLALLDKASAEVSPALISTLLDRCSEVTERASRLNDKTVQGLLDQVIIHPSHVELRLDAAGVGEAHGLNELPMLEDVLALSFSVDATVKRTGTVLKLVEPSGQSAVTHKPDLGLIKLIHQAHLWWDELKQGAINIADLARREKVTASWMTRVVRLAFLSPEVVEAIIAGRARADLDAKALLATGAIPSCWDEQRAKFLPRPPGNLSPPRPNSRKAQEVLEHA
ncbi:MAG: recombinase family protein [Pseudomonadota bacterium]